MSATYTVTCLTPLASSVANQATLKVGAPSASAPREVTVSAVSGALASSVWLMASLSMGGASSKNTRAEAPMAAPVAASGAAVTV